MAIEIRSLSRHIGAEIVGIDLSKPIDKDVANDLRRTFNERLLYLIRQPDVSAEDQIRFGKVFGDVHLRTKYSVPVEVPLTQFVSNARADGILGDVELSFHQDHCFYQSPLKALILYGIEIPKSGSVTKFRSAVSVLENLPTDLRRRADGVRCLYDGGLTPPYDPSKSKLDQPRAWQPMVWTEPETGKQALLASPTTIAAFDGVSPEEGRRLLDEIWDFAASTETFTYAHHWAPGDLVILHNCLAQHARMPFNGAERRTLRRTQVHYSGTYQA